MLVFGLALSTLACARKPPVFGSGLPSVRASREEASFERQMFERLNRDRAARGLPALMFDERLSEIARYHSKDMRDAGFFGHESPTTGSPQDRMDRAGYLAAESRENVAQAPNASIAQDQLLDSPGHYANIVATTVTHVGIGVVKDKGIPGQVRGYYFTQLFANPVKSQSAQQADAVIMAKISDFRAKTGLTPLAQHPLLQRFARELVEGVDANEPNEGLGPIGDTILSKLQAESGHGLRSVATAAQVGLSAEMFRPEGLIDPGVKAIGYASALDHDAQGKRVVKVLFIVGR